MKMKSKNFNQNSYDYDTVVAELSAGIVELIYTDEYSVEYIISATQSHNHLDENDPAPNSKKTNNICVWNLVEEEWQNIVISSIIHLDRLTGNGIKSNEDKINSEMIEKILLQQNDE